MDANHDIITALSPTKRDPGRLTIKVAGRAVATMQAKRIAELGLEIGMPWTDALAEQVAHAAAFDKAMRAAMNRLNRRAMSRSQLRRKLTDRKLELDVAAVDAALDRLEELDLIDDEAFGRALIAEILRGRPAGPMLLRQKLMQRGLERNLIDRLIAENEPSEEAAIEGAVKLATTSCGRCSATMPRRASADCGACFKGAGSAVTLSPARCRNSTGWMMSRLIDNRIKKSPRR